MIATDPLVIFANGFLEGILYGLAPILFAAILVFFFAFLFARHAFHAFVFSSAAAIGCFLGVFVGGSREPVVSVFLPAIVTLLATLIAYYFKKDEEIFNRRLVPGSIISLVLAASFGSYFASELRATSLQVDYLATIAKSDRESKIRKDEISHEKLVVFLNRYAYCVQQFDGDTCLKLQGVALDE